MKTKRLTITVQRTVSRAGNRYWYFQGGKKVDMAEALALEGARKGRLKIKTVDRRLCA